jgi:hypothetical protein
MRVLAAAVLSLVASSPPHARADGPDITQKLNDFSNDFGGHLRDLTFDAIDLRFDLRDNRARVRVHVPLLVLDGDVKWVDGVARVDARIDFKVGTHELNFALPTFELVPQDWEGQRWVEVRVPLISGRF